MSHPLYWVALQAALGIPCKKVGGLISVFGSPEKIFEATQEQLEDCGMLKAAQIKAILNKPYDRAKEIYYACKKEGIDIYTPEHPLYPGRLRNMKDFPCVLYGKGVLPVLDGKPVISIVGSRKPTRYGKIVAEQIAGVLAAAGVTVVSGGALGIDAIAHEAAMWAGGITIGVLGCGIAAPYLATNRKLREGISKQGCLLSEYPPYTSATRYTFPVRNRLIAALSLGTVVVEAGAKSGSLITADRALEQDRDVFVVPGSIAFPGFQGSNQLIANGAITVFNGLDVLKKYERDYCRDLNMKRARALHEQHVAQQLVEAEQWGLSSPLKEKEKKAKESRELETRESPSHKKNLRDAGKDLSEPALRVYNIILDAKTILLADVIGLAQLPPHQVLRELTALEIEGLVEKGPAGQYTVVG